MVTDLRVHGQRRLNQTSNLRVSALGLSTLCPPTPPRFHADLGCFPFHVHILGCPGAFLGHSSRLAQPLVGLAFLFLTCW